MKKKIVINIKQATEGMQLAADAVDSKGVCLVSAGSYLTTTSITGFIKRDIREIEIYQLEQLSEEKIQQLRKDIEQQVNLCFSKVEKNHLMKELKQVFFEYRTRDL